MRPSSDRLVFKMRIPIPVIETQAQANVFSIQWRPYGRDGVSNHQPHDCLVNRLFGRRSKKASKLRVTGLCEGNSPVTDEFPAQRASNTINISFWWRHRVARFSDAIDLLNIGCSQMHSLVINSSKCLLAFVKTLLEYKYSVCFRPLLIPKW